MKEESSNGRILEGIKIYFLIGCHLKSLCCDPKDGELYLSRIKSEETPMEVRSNTDVQIVCQI
jgi:hypothetical protein